MSPTLEQAAAAVQCRSPDLSLSLSLCLDSLTVNPSRHKQRRQLGNRTIAILQRHSIMTTSDRFHTLLKNSSNPPPPPRLLFSISHLHSITVSLAHTPLPLSSVNYCKVSMSRISFFIQFLLFLLIYSRFVFKYLSCYFSLITPSLHFCLLPFLSLSLSFSSRISACWRIQSLVV